MLRRHPAPAVPAWLERMLPFERFTVDVDGLSMHVMESGPAGGRPVLLLHGNPTWGFLWRKVALALEGSGLHCIMPDMIGLGLSDKPRDPRVHTLESHGRWLARLIEGLELDGLVFAGQDWGGPVGISALAGMPDRVAGLVLMNTVIGPPRPGFRPSAFHRLCQVPVVSDLLFRVLGFPQNALALAQGDWRSIAGDVARAYRWPLRHPLDNAAPLALGRMVPDGPEHPSIPALRRCQAFVEGWRGPAALVWGLADPVLGRVGSWVLKCLPQASMLETQAGHFLQEEVPLAIAGAVREVARGILP